MRNSVSRVSLVAAASLALLCSGCYQAQGNDSPTSARDLTQVHAACVQEVRKTLTQLAPGTEDTADDYVQLGPNRHSLRVVTGRDQKGSPPATISAVRCILGQTRAPAHVTSQLSNLDGLQGSHVASWDAMSLTWSYDTDTGLKAVFRAKG